MAVGSIASVDDANTVLLAGRADLCLLARPHLIDPYWTLNAAIDQSFGDGVSWPAPYLSARTARRRHQEAVASTVRDPR
jgi:anthraniloyl-CoA monooxygenase